MSSQRLVSSGLSIAELRSAQKRFADPTFGFSVAAIERGGPCGAQRDDENWPGALTPS